MSAKSLPLSCPCLSKTSSSSFSARTGTRPSSRWGKGRGHPCPPRLAARRSRAWRSSFTLQRRRWKRSRRTLLQMKKDMDDHQENPRNAPDVLKRSVRLCIKVGKTSARCFIIFQMFYFLNHLTDDWKNKTSDESRVLSWCWIWLWMIRARRLSSSRTSSTTVQEEATRYACGFSTPCMFSTTRNQRCHISSVCTFPTLCH